MGCGETIVQRGFIEISNNETAINNKIMKLLESLFFFLEISETSKHTVNTFNDEMTMTGTSPF